MNETTTTADQPPAMQFAGREILVVDDNHDVAESLAMLLSVHDAHPTLAYSGQQALDVFLADRHAIAILDIGLPDMDGLELGRRLREQSADCLLIALSGYHAKREQVECDGVFDLFLLKPVTVGRLLDAIQSSRKFDASN